MSLKKTICTFVFNILWVRIHVSMDRRGRRLFIWPQILCLACFSALTKECSGEYPQYLALSFYTLLPFKTSKHIAKEDSRIFFSTCRKLNSWITTCWGSPCKPTTESRADFRSSAIVYSASLARWWFSGWKLHGWMGGEFTNAEFCLCNDLLTDLQSTHLNLLCLWRSWEKCCHPPNCQYQQHQP